MKNILKYIMLVAVALMATACQEGLDQLSDSDQGCVTLNIKMMEQQTRFTAPEELRVRVFDTKGTDVKTDDVLVRIFTEEDEIPNEIYLIEGNYRITVEGRDKAHTEVFKESDANPKAKLYYKGEATLEVEAGATTQANVECYPQNVRVGVSLDETQGENAKLQDVKISLAAVTLVGKESYTSTDFTEATKAGVKKLDFGGTGDDSFTGTSYGFFLLADGVMKGNIAWVATGNHVDDKETADNTADDVTTPFDKAGQFEVEPGKAYKVNFVFQKAPNGAVTVDIKVVQLVEVIENEFGFKPQPEFSSMQWLKADKDDASKNVYGGNSVAFAVEGLNPMDKLEVNDIEIQLTSQTNTVSGVTVTPVAGKEAGTAYSITLGSDFFKSMAGGVQDLKFEAFEGGSLAGEYEMKFTNMGLDIGQTESDLWANTATFMALITDGSSSNVKVKFRRKGTEDWAETGVATPDNNGIATVTSVAAWSDAITNEAGKTVYTPNVDKSIFANNIYECQLVIGENTYGPIVEYDLSGKGQDIPYAKFDDKNLDCFKVLVDNEAKYWGSGNNTAVGDLCTYETYAGTQGNNGRAKLKTKFVNAIIIKTIATGNLFTGKFKMNGTSGGTVSFGVNYPWSARPIGLSLKCQYDIGTVDYVDSEFGIKEMEDQPDQASIFVAIVDWGSQHQVSSGTSAPSGMWSPENGADVVPSSGKIIGYGVKYLSGENETMEDINIPIYYYNPADSKPNNNYTLVISAANSRYGDYMTGCTTNVMYVDDFQWVY